MTVTMPPTGMLPVQVMAVELRISVPEVAVWSPLGMASSNDAAATVAMLIPV